MGFFLYILIIIFLSLFDNHKISILFFIIGCIASLTLLYYGVRPTPHKNKTPFLHKELLTKFEQKMFLRLKNALPQYHVCPQVAFSALITQDDYKIRQMFNRKVTDFVLIDQHCKVIAIIELDDPSHVGKEKQDQQRDAMLNDAGYTVYRYTSIPTVKRLQKDFP